MQVAVFINMNAAWKRAARIKEKTSVIPMYKRGALQGYKIWLHKSEAWIMEQ